MSDMTLLRIGIAVAMSLLLGAIIFFGRSRKDGQGRRVPREAGGEASGRVEPSAGSGDDVAWGEDAEQEELPLGSPAPQSELGKRPVDQFDRIISLYVAAKAGSKLRGPDIVVAAEKAGLTFGYMDVFHRLVDGRPEVGPIFSPIVLGMGGGWLIANLLIAVVGFAPGAGGAQVAWDVHLWGFALGLLLVEPIGRLAGHVRVN